MDKQLLKALDNLSNALEMIAEALEKKDSGGGSSATTTALQGGDFGKSLQQINLGIKSIKVDTQQILKQQQTILGMQKKKDDDKKTGLFGEAGENKERENKMKKGIGIILLIAIAVLMLPLAVVNAQGSSSELKLSLKEAQDYALAYNKSIKSAKFDPTKTASALVSIH
jgi:hypothetical protein